MTSGFKASSTFVMSLNVSVYDRKFKSKPRSGDIWVNYLEDRGGWNAMG